MEKIKMVQFGCTHTYHYFRNIGQCFFPSLASVIWETFIAFRLDIRACACKEKSGRGETVKS